jgi:hypothetical protein
MGPPHLYEVKATGVVEFFISQVGHEVDTVAAALEDRNSLACSAGFGFWAPLVTT